MYEEQHLAAGDDESSPTTHVEDDAHSSMDDANDTSDGGDSTPQPFREHDVDDAGKGTSKDVVADEKKKKTEVVIAVADKHTVTMHAKQHPVRLNKAQTVSQIRSLATRTATLEGDIKSKLKRIRSHERDPEYIENLEQTKVDDANRRYKDKESLQAQIYRISSEVKKFNDMLKNVSSAPSFVERVQRLMEQIESSILTLKQKQKSIYESLEAQEILLERDINATAEALEVWERQSHPSAGQSKRKRTSKVANQQEFSILPEVAALTNYLDRTGGMTGGWTEYDHGVFLRERQRNSKSQNAITATSKKLIGKSTEECHDHEKWYTEYLRLNESKKVAIRKWKIDKERSIAQEARARELAAEEQERHDKLIATRRAKAAEEEKKRKAAEIARWKQEQEFRKAAESERLEEQRLAERKAMEKIERERHKTQKAKVESYLEEKRHRNEILIKIANEKRAAATTRVTEAELKYYREKDKKILAQKVAARKAASEEDKERLKRLERIKSQVKVTTERDPSRLSRPTAASMARKNDNSTTGQMHIFSGGRAVPSWRK